MTSEINLRDIEEKMHKGFDVIKTSMDEQSDRIKKGLGTLGTLEEKMARAEAEIARVEKQYLDDRKRRLADENMLSTLKEMDSPSRPEERKVGEKLAFKEMVRNDRILTDALKPFVLRPISDDVAKLLKQLSPDQVKGLAIGNDTAAGYLAPPEYVQEIIKGVVEYSPIRALARIFPTSRYMIQVPKKTGAITAAWTSEIGTKSESTGMTYGLEDIACHEMTAKIIASNWQLEDSVFDIEALIQTECSEQFGKAEGTAFVSGTGVGRPEGIANGTGTNATLVTCADTSGHLLATNDLISAQFAVPEVYQANATWLLKWSQIGSVRKLKDATSGQYLWAPLREGTPPMILGRPYLACPDLALDSATPAAGKHVAMYGDFRRGYAIADRIEISMLRDPYGAAGTNQVIFWARKRVGGQVILAEAIADVVTG